MMVPRADFDWTDRDTVVVPEQRAIAVYTNPHGDIVIRQQVEFDEDVFVVLAPQHARAIAEAVLAWADGSVQWQRKDPTGAERQRRRRQRRAAAPLATRDAAVDVTRDVTLFERDGDPTEKAAE